jgi:hypothetical protein
MADLDLDIHNYSIQDMKNFFRLDKNFSESDVEKREYEIREQLLSSGHINKRLKRDLIAFLTEVKKYIIYHTFPKKEYHNPGLERKLDPYPEIPNVPYPPSNIREQEILQRPTNQYIYTQNSDYLPGILNPVQIRTLTQCISIDTRFRENVYTTQSSDFAMNIPNKIKKVLSMQLSAIEITKENFYNISNSLKNNYLYISVISTEYEDEPKNVFFIPDGNYNADQLLKVLNKLLRENEETPFSKLNFSLDIYGSGRICLGALDDSILSISLDFTMDETGNTDNNTVDYLSKLGRVLGFTKRKYKGDNYYMAETVVNTNIAFSYIYLSIDDFQNNSPPSFVTAFQNNNIPTSILARIQISDSVTFISEPRKYFGPVDLTRIQIRLLDAYGRILDMNGSDYSFCLLLNLVYDF